ncbi:MAG: hypothetical protein KDN19_09360, partial [Verrucomicrobiae bacterium]|nr:hypothetical protein [Verrucomicrobiae bacterium]
MNRIGIIIRNLFLGLATIGLLGALVAADWYVRYDPVRKARRLLEAQQTPLNSASAVAAAAEGNVFNLEQLDLAEVDLSSPDTGSGLTPLLAAIRFGQTEATNLLLSKDS